MSSGKVVLMIKLYQDSVTWRICLREKRIKKKILTPRYRLNNSRLLLFSLKTLVERELRHYSRYKSKLVSIFRVIERENKKSDTFHLRFDLKGEVRGW
ncbi:hypothetical protein SUSAZ_00550 [Sulfolobus acidocaldarius SUSAZ]|nr:hypothetical protein SUSAZ_00550 [Sulfolobus acidocaldarius SUSAZ]